ncbi:sucrose transport protein SUT2-like isoform X2 [Typha angustifolia]|uniref:sucrose transport protein SUT2-like isoform X2 n=1 Tax=Typha angustifolia TaxID=59011 RepID=UPI003C2B2AC7
MTGAQRSRTTAPSRHAAAPPPPPQGRRVPLRRLLRVASVACGVQFGWALQLSLLTPYVQELGIPHEFASLVWLCGPLSGLLVQPLVGHLSDRVAGPLGRRRPFIVGGAAAIAAAVLTIGFSADIGRALGDPVGKRPRAVVVYLIGFWLLDVGNNTTQGPCRALLGDLTGKDQRRTRIANAYFSLFMALGNILGFAAGSYSGWFTIFPFTVTSACGVNCANLKSVFLLDTILLAFTTYISVTAVQEVPEPSGHQLPNSIEGTQQLNIGEEAFLWELMGSFREIYKGNPGEGQNYHNGVRMGAFALMLNSVVLGFTSVILEKLCKKWGAGLVWGVSNILMSFCFLAMLIITSIAKSTDYTPNGLPPDGIVVAALVVFAILGAPLAITYSIPYAMISTRIESLRLGQGLAMGILNLAIVIPQMLISLGSGPWDQLFGGGNSPSFAVAAAAAFFSGLVAIIGLPRSYIARTRGHR